MLAAMWQEHIGRRRRGRHPVGAGRRAESCEIHTIERPSDLDRLAPAWDRLASRSGSPIEQFAWARACAETMADRYRLQILAVGPPDRPCAIAPLVRRRRLFAPLELLGVSELGEPMDLLYADASAAAALVEALAGSFASVALKRVPVTSPALDAISRAWPKSGVVLRREVAGHPYIPLDDTWKEPERNFNSRRRADLRRAERRAEKLGALRCEIMSPTEADLGPLLDELFRVEAAGWKGRARTALAHDPVRGAFFRRYAAAAASTGILRLCFLRIGDRAAAVQLAVQTGERFWLFKVGYDDEFARCSPGALLMRNTVAHAAKQGLQAYELLGHAEPWTEMWTRTMRPCVRLHAYPPRVRGLSTLAVDAGIEGGRRLGRMIRSRR
jgi:CelD/BcsL family acetyltransferase involved in cellulose biosynthesis